MRHLQAMRLAAMIENNFILSEMSALLSRLEAKG